ncbi:hypothetical protein [Thiomicrorhabdus indica]|uniref:hypothetical protein n=1 Tax=Thiomicrorhabdus indica TaxID=2267253 RepID=UPI002AA7F467|nr:hypothetical protein [Thiomicrorhabdus indica]
MPGTSERFEIANLDGVSEKFAVAVRLLINHYSLKSLVEFMQNGVSDAIKEKCPSIREKEWEYLLPQVVFSKITSLELNAKYPSEHLEYLISLLNQCFNGGSHQSSIEWQDLPADYLIAQTWLKKAQSLQGKK